MKTEMKLENFLANTNTIIVHHTDLDGICAAAVVYNSGKINTETSAFVPYYYNDDNITVIHANGDSIKANMKEVVNYAISSAIKIIIVDISIESLNSPLAEIFKSGYKNFVWCDHHLSSVDFIKIYNEYANTKAEFDGIVDINYCGAALTYMHFFNTNKFPHIIKLVNDHDLWRHEMGGQFINTAFHYDGETDLDKKLNNPKSPKWKELLESNDKTKELFEKGIELKNVEDSNNATIWKRTGFCFNLDLETDSYIIRLNACAVNGVGNSELFPTDIYSCSDVVIRMNMAYDFENKHIYYQYTAYSMNDSIVYCNELAKILRGEGHNGGGHQHAAGFSSSKNIFEDVCMKAGNYGLPVLTVHVSEEELNKIVTPNLKTPIKK